MEYQIIWHNLIEGELLKDSFELLEQISGDLEQLVELEKEGKIKGYCIDIEPSIQGIEVLDPTVEPELKENNLVACFESEDNPESGL